MTSHSKTLEVLVVPNKSKESWTLPQVSFFRVFFLVVNMLKKSRKQLEVFRKKLALLSVTLPTEIIFFFFLLCTEKNFSKLSAAPNNPF